MLLTPHVLAGITIATKVQNPVLGLFLAFLSHYFLDAAPQTEYSIENIVAKRWRKSLPDFLKVFAEVVFCLSIIFFVTEHSPFILLAAFLAVLPDGFTFAHHFLPQSKLLEKHQKLHCAINNFGENIKISPFWGVLSQVLVVFISLFFLLQR
jgi:hypothetical protein